MNFPTLFYPVQKLKFQISWTTSTTYGKMKGWTVGDGLGYTIVYLNADPNLKSGICGVGEVDTGVDVHSSHPHSVSNSLVSPIWLPFTFSSFCVRGAVLSSEAPVIRVSLLISILRRSRCLLPTTIDDLRIPILRS